MSQPGEVGTGPPKPGPIRSACRYVSGWFRSPLGKASAAAASTFILLQVVFAIIVHYSYEGKYSGPFLISNVFGVPSQEAAAGIQAVVPKKHGPGWDGQLYYFQSNDPLGLTDAPSHFDDVSYRYQRIGVPFLAYASARLLGYSITPPLLYHSIQFLITSLGCGGLVYWLARNNLSPWYATAWLLSGGVLLVTFHGLPDAVGDALFVLTFLALLSKRIWTYAILASGLLLVREGYVVFPAVIFLITACKRISWGEPGIYWRRLLITALPALPLLAWSAYLAWHFQISPLSSSRNVPGLVDYPLQGFLKCFRIDWKYGNYFEVPYKLAFVFTLVVITVTLVRKCRQSVCLAATIPYVFLVLTLGTIVWQSVGGYPKAIGTILVIGIFLLKFERGLLLRYVLAANVVVGLHLTYQTKVAGAPLFSPVLCKAIDAAPSEAPEGGGDTLVTDFHSTARWIDPASSIQLSYRGIWSKVHREVVPIRVRVTNCSEAAWTPKCQVGEVSFPIRAGAILYGSDGRTEVRKVTSNPLEGTIAPGESRDVELYLPIAPGKYFLQLSVVQENHKWFYLDDARHGERHEIIVR